MKLKKLEDLTELERMALINMSYSRLNTYEMCASKYYYTYIQKEERVFGPAATLGNIIHNTLEDTVGGPLTEEILFERMHHHRGVLDPEHQIDKVLMDAGREMVLEFIDRHEDEKFDILGKELPFELVIGSALIIGYIDLVTKDANGTIRITDYKSGKWEVAAKRIHEDLQVGLYALAASLMYPDTPVYAELYYLRSGRRKGHLYTPEDLDGVYDVVLRKINEIIEDQNFKATPETRPCTFCDFAKTKVCPTGTARMRNRRW